MPLMVASWPPGMSGTSTSVEWPKRAAKRPAVSPATPPPMTAMSYAMRLPGRVEQHLAGDGAGLDQAMALGRLRERQDAVDDGRLHGAVARRVHRPLDVLGVRVRVAHDRD